MHTSPSGQTFVRARKEGFEKGGSGGGGGAGGGGGV